MSFKLFLPLVASATRRLGRNSQMVKQHFAPQQQLRFGHHGSSLPNLDDPSAFNKYFIEKFNRNDIDGWDLRQVMNNLIGMDCIPDPSVSEAVLRACRRVNDIALAIRWLEACKDKCGSEEEIYSYLMQEIRPVLCELGIPTLEELNYDRPEMALKSVFDL